MRHRGARPLSTRTSAQPAAETTRVNSSDRLVKRGDGWQIGWDASAPEFCGLVGTDRWAIELTAAEFDDFCRLAQQVADALRAIAAELMDGERVACEAESATLWLEAEGFPERYTLQAILKSGRRCEAFWDEVAARELTTAARSIHVFSETA